MNRSDIRTRIRAFIGETTAATWSDGNLNTYIQMALDDLSDHAVLSGSRSFTIINGTATIPEDVIRVQSLTMSDQHIRIVRPSVAHKYVYDSGVVTGDESTRTLACKATDGALSAFCVLRHPDLTSDTDPITLDRRFQNALVYYATGLALLKTEDNATSHFQLYDRELAKLSKSVKCDRLFNFYEEMPMRGQF